MSHVTLVNESRHVTYLKKSGHSYEWEKCHMWIHAWKVVRWLSQRARFEWAMSHMNEACHTYEWVMSHIWTGEITHVNSDVKGRALAIAEGRPLMRHVTREWVVSHVNGLCHTYEWILPHIWMFEVTYLNPNVKGRALAIAEGKLWVSHVTHEFRC